MLSMGTLSGRGYARTAIVCSVLLLTLPWMGALGTVSGNVRDHWNDGPADTSEPWTLVGWSYHPDGPTYLALFARETGNGTQFRLDGQISMETVRSVVEEKWWKYAEKFFVVIRVYTDDGDGWHLIEPDEGDPDSKPRYDDDVGHDVVHVEVKESYDWNQGSQGFKDYDLGTHDIPWDEDLRWTFWVGCGGNNFKYRSSNSIWSTAVQAWSDNFEGIAVACSLVAASLYFSALACTVSGFAAPLAPFLAAAGFAIEMFVVVSYIVHCAVKLVKAKCDYLMTALAGDGRLEGAPTLLDPGNLMVDDDGDPETPMVPAYPSANRLVHVDSDNDNWTGKDSFEDDSTGSTPLDVGILKGVCLAKGGIRKVGAHFSIEGAWFDEPAETITRNEEVYTEIVHSIEMDNTINESWYSGSLRPETVSIWSREVLSLNGQPLLLIRFCQKVDYETKHFGTGVPSGIPPWPTAAQSYTGHWILWGMDGDTPVELTRERELEVQWRYPEHPDDSEVVVDIEELLDLVEENTGDRTWIDDYLPEAPEEDDIIVTDPRLKNLYRMLQEISEEATT